MLEQKFASNLDDLNLVNTATQVALAVSGGVDSIALLLLMYDWAKDKNIDLTVLTVNHNLRNNAKFECEYVFELANDLGIKAFILDWNHDNKFNNLSARARDGRYKLMTDYCKELDIITLLTAHHYNDSVENFYIRKTRKSGLLGLSVTNTSFCNNVRIFRPLFNIEKNELISYVSSKKVKWLEDESNNSDKYLRNTIRKKIANEDNLIDAFKAEQKNIDQEIININNNLIEAIAESVSIYHYGFAKLSVINVLQYSFEVKLRLIIYLLNMISGNVSSPRGRAVHKLLNLINLSKDFSHTLHNCFIKRIGSDIIIYREYGKNLPLDIRLNENIKWDNRFLLKNLKTFDKELASSMFITNLTLDDYITIKDNLNLTELADLSFKHHREILFTLPVIKTLEKVIALPHISYYDEYNWIKDITFSYQPNFISRFIHFY